MTRINYKLPNGQFVEIEVSDEVSEVIVELEHEEQRDIWREKKRKNKSLDYLGSLGIDIPDADVNIEEDYIKSEETKKLLQALSKLPPNQKDLIQQVFFQDRKIVDIAREQGVNEATIRTKLKRIYEKLKKLM